VSPVSPAAHEKATLLAVKVSAATTACFRFVAEIQYDPLLEEIRQLRASTIPDPEVAMTAATMLGKFGSPAAESLSGRLRELERAVVGRESQLDRMFADGLDEKVYQLGLA